MWGTRIFSLPVVASTYIYVLVSDSDRNKDIKPALGLPTRQQIRADGGQWSGGSAPCRVRHATGRTAVLPSHIMSIFRTLEHYKWYKRNLVATSQRTQSVCIINTNHLSLFFFARIIRDTGVASYFVYQLKQVYRRILGPVYGNEKENWMILTNKEIYSSLKKPTIIRDNRVK